MYHAKYFNPEKTAIVCHFDGHGVTAGCLLARKLNIPLTNIFSKFPVTGPDGFANILDNYALENYNHIYVIDIPINLKDPASFIATFHKIFHAFRLKNPNEKLYLFYIDHHETSVPFIFNLPLFVRPIFVQTAYLLNKLCAKDSEVDKKLAIIGAICDRDESVIPLVTNELQEIALGIDVLVRENIDLAINLCYEGKLDELKKYAKKVPEVTKYTTYNNVVLAEEKLVPAWGPKSLEQLALKTNTIYAIGVSFMPNLNQWIVRAIKLWTKTNFPSVKELISDLDAVKGRRILGHPNAPTIACTSEQDAFELARKIAEYLDKRISVRTAVDDKIKTMSSDELEKLIQLLKQLR